MFKLKSSYKPAWDQPKAIKQIVDWFQNKNYKQITLLWATWTWKTFTMANVIAKLQKPTLVLSHNKTLAAQLATEFKYFFPENAVHYFVSYFDYYQPEAYIPERDMYIEKDSSINKEIEMYRLSTLSSLLSRKDVIVVSSVSALYGLGSRETFEKYTLTFEVWKEYNFSEIKKKLLYMQYKPVQWKIEPWMFDFRWEILDIFSSIDNIVYRLIFDEEELAMIQMKDSLSWKDLWTLKKVTIWPATQFLQEMDQLDTIIKLIKQDLDERVNQLKKQWKNLEAERLKKRTMYDIRMIQETWYVNWIENYSPYFEWRLNWEPPNTLFDYFPDDFLLIIDESHMTIPQLRAMPQWDRSRKLNLIEYWFRLPSAIHHRPLKFEELEVILWRKTPEQAKAEIDESNLKDYEKIKREEVEKKIKKNCKTLFVSATPAEYELNLSQLIVEQIIRPTWLLDPITYVYPKSGDYEILLKSLEKLLKKKPYLKQYLSWYDENIDLKKLFL